MPWIVAPDPMFGISDSVTILQSKQNQHKAIQLWESRLYRSIDMPLLNVPFPDLSFLCMSSCLVSPFIILDQRSHGILLQS